MIAEEALNSVGILAPSAAQIAQAEDVFLRAILADIWTSPGKSFNTRLKSFQAKNVQIITEGLSKYSVPSDFDEEITLTLLSGGHSGTAQAGTATSITFEVGEDATNIEGKYVLILSGTGVTGLQQCTSYNSTTLEASCSEWTIAPDATSVYLLIDQEIELEEKAIQELQGLGGYSKAKPTQFTKINESGVEYFIFNNPPDKIYGLLTRYYLNPILLDEVGVVMSGVYSKWYQVLLCGTAWKVAEYEDDDRCDKKKEEYYRLKSGLLAKEIPYGGVFKGFEL